MLRNMIILFALMAILAVPALAQNTVSVRIKDITHFKGDAGIPLFGEGLVTGLAGTGDDKSIPTITMHRDYSQSLRPRKDAKLEDYASTAVGRVSVQMTVGTDYTSATGGLQATVTVLDLSKSLKNGMLIRTELFDRPGGKVIGYASGQLVVDSNRPAMATVPATLVRDLDVKQYQSEMDANGVERKYLSILLDEPDSTTQASIIQAINDLASRLGETGTDVAPGEEKIVDAAKIASEVDGTKDAIKVMIPKNYEKEVSSFISLIHAVEVNPDVAARIVINKATGVVSWNGNVRIAQGVVSIGGVSITIPASGVVPTQPAPGDEVQDPTVALGGKPAVTMDDFISAINSLGLTIEAKHAVFQSMKDAGYLFGKVIVKQ